MLLSKQPGDTGVYATATASRVSVYDLSNTRGSFSHRRQHRDPLEGLQDLLPQQPSPWPQTPPPLLRPSAPVLAVYAQYHPRWGYPIRPTYVLPLGGHHLGGAAGPRAFFSFPATRPLPFSSSNSGGSHSQGPAYDVSPSAPQHVAASHPTSSQGGFLPTSLSLNCASDRVLFFLSGDAGPKGGGGGASLSSSESGWIGSCDAPHLSAMVISSRMGAAGGAGANSGFVSGSCSWSTHAAPVPSGLSSPQQVDLNGAAAGSRPCPDDVDYGVGDAEESVVVSSDNAEDTHNGCRAAAARPLRNPSSAASPQQAEGAVGGGLGAQLYNEGLLPRPRARVLGPVSASGWDPRNAATLALGRHDGVVQLLDVEYLLGGADAACGGGGGVDRGGSAVSASSMGEGATTYHHPYGEVVRAASTYHVQQIHCSTVQERQLTGQVTAMDWVPQSHLTVVAARRQDGLGYYAELLDLRSPDSVVHYLGAPPEVLGAPFVFRSGASPAPAGGGHGGKEGGRGGGGGGAGGGTPLSSTISPYVLCYGEHVACDPSKRYVATVGTQHNTDVIQLWDLRLTARPLSQKVFAKVGYTSLCWSAVEPLTVIGATKAGELRVHTFAGDAGHPSGPGHGGGDSDDLLPLLRRRPSTRDPEELKHRSRAGSVGEPRANTGFLFERRHRRNGANLLQGFHNTYTEEEEENDDEGGGDGGDDSGDGAPSDGSVMGTATTASSLNGELALTVSGSGGIHAGVGAGAVFAPRMKSRSVGKSRLASRMPAASVAWATVPPFADRGPAPAMPGPRVYPVQPGSRTDLPRLVVLNAENGELYYQVYDRRGSTVTSYGGAMPLAAAGPNLLAVDVKGSRRAAKEAEESALLSMIEDCLAALRSGASRKGEDHERNSELRTEPLLLRVVRRALAAASGGGDGEEGPIASRRQYHNGDSSNNSRTAASATGDSTSIGGGAATTSSGSAAPSGSGSPENSAAAPIVSLSAIAVASSGGGSSSAVAVANATAAAAAAKDYTGIDLLDNDDDDDADGHGSHNTGPHHHHHHLLGTAPKGAGSTPPATGPAAATARAPGPDAAVGRDASHASLAAGDAAMGAGSVDGTSLDAVADRPGSRGGGAESPTAAQIPQLSLAFSSPPYRELMRGVAPDDVPLFSYLLDVLPLCASLGFPDRQSLAVSRLASGFTTDAKRNLRVLASEGRDKEAYALFSYGLTIAHHLYGKKAEGKGEQQTQGNEYHRRHLPHPGDGACRDMAIEGSAAGGSSNAGDDPAVVPITQAVPGMLELLVAEHRERERLGLLDAPLPRPRQTPQMQNTASATGVVRSPTNALGSSGVGGGGGGWPGVSPGGLPGVLPGRRLPGPLHPPPLPPGISGQASAAVAAAMQPAPHAALGALRELFLQAMGWTRPGGSGGAAAAAAPSPLPSGAGRTRGATVTVPNSGHRRRDPQTFFLDGDGIGMQSLQECIERRVCLYTLMDKLSEAAELLALYGAYHPLYPSTALELSAAAAAAAAAAVSKARTKRGKASPAALETVADGGGGDKDLRRGVGNVSLLSIMRGEGGSLAGGEAAAVFSPVWQRTVGCTFWLSLALSYVRSAVAAFIHTPPQTDATAQAEEEGVQGTDGDAEREGGWSTSMSCMTLPEQRRFVTGLLRSFPRLPLPDVLGLATALLLPPRYTAGHIDNLVGVVQALVHQQYEYGPVPTATTPHAASFPLTGSTTAMPTGKPHAQQQEQGATTAVPAALLGSLRHPQRRRADEAAHLSRLMSLTSRCSLLLTAAVEGVGLETAALQRYVDESTDVQTPLCYASAFGPTQSTTFRTWKEAYRAALNANSHFMLRSQHDLQCIKTLKARSESTPLAAQPAGMLLPRVGAAAGGVGSGAGGEALKPPVFRAMGGLGDLAPPPGMVGGALNRMMKHTLGALGGGPPAMTSRTRNRVTSPSSSTPGSGGGVGGGPGGVGPLAFNAMMSAGHNAATAGFANADLSRSVELRCNCGQAMHATAVTKGATSSAAAAAAATSHARKQMVPCGNPECRQWQTPMCTVCGERMESRAMELPPERSFAWCTVCLHGGHYCHVSEWFAKHTKCPVEDCPCQCCDAEDLS